MSKSSIFWASQMQWFQDCTKDKHKPWHWQGCKQMSYFTDINLNHTSACWALKASFVRNTCSLCCLSTCCSSRQTTCFNGFSESQFWPADEVNDTLKCFLRIDILLYHSSRRERPSKSFSLYKKACSKFNSTEFRIASIKHNRNAFRLMFNSLSLLQDQTNFLRIHVQ